MALPKHYHVCWGFAGCLPDGNVAFTDEEMALSYLDGLLIEYTDAGLVVEAIIEETDNREYTIGDSCYYVQFFTCTDSGDVCREAFEEEG